MGFTMQYSIITDFNELEAKFKAGTIQVHELHQFMTLKRDIMILADYIDLQNENTDIKGDLQ